MKKTITTALCFLLCFLTFFSVVACDEGEETPIGGEEWMDVARIEVSFGEEVRLFTSEVRKREIKALVDAIKTGTTVSDLPSADRADGEYDMIFSDFLTGSARSAHYRLTPTVLFDLTSDTAYAVTQAQYDALVAILTIPPTPGQSL
ncbi:MAG: hypothetical protein IJV96_00750 [Clostridia bacterium]|nr:hypothetical protein [Clostridia bacterium]